MAMGRRVEKQGSLDCLELFQLGFRAFASTVWNSCKLALFLLILTDRMNIQGASITGLYPCHDCLFLQRPERPRRSCCRDRRVGYAAHGEAGLWLSRLLRRMRPLRPHHQADHERGPDQRVDRRSCGYRRCLYHRVLFRLSAQPCAPSRPWWRGWRGQRRSYPNRRNGLIIHKIFVSQNCAAGSGMARCRVLVSGRIIGLAPAVNMI